MPLGEFSIGRSSNCNLALADSLVSRKHALLHVTESGVTAQDLGSRNGVSVNGIRIDKPQTLDHLDRVYIGSQELVLIDGGRIGEGADETSGYITCDACGTLNGAAKRRCDECGELLANASTRTLSSRLDEEKAESASVHPAVPEETRRARLLEVIGPIASKALVLGHYVEAEKILLPHMKSLLERTESGTRIDNQTVRKATEFALRLCDGLNRGKWLDFAFRLHTATNTLVDATTVDELHDIVRRVGYSNTRYLRRYLKSIASRADSFSAAERFVVRRLEGLEQVIAAS